MTELILIRHGETDLNRGPYFQGQIDVALNERGLEQARRLAQRLTGESIDVLVCSDLTRTRQTAAPSSAQLGLPPQPLAELREQHFGMFEGLSFPQVMERHPEQWQSWSRHDPEYALPGGESMRQFHARVVAAIHALAARHAGRNVVVVTHGGVLDMVWRTAHALPLHGPRQCPIPNAGLNRLSVTATHIEVIAWADDAHVRDLSADAPPAPPLEGHVAATDSSPSPR